MNATADLPLWVAVLVAIFIIFGAAVTLLGAIGLVRMRTFYARLHAPTLGTTLGTGGVLVASMILSSALQSRLVLHEIAIAVFVTVTTPVTLMLLGRAALYRDRIEKKPGIPPFESER
ncbi:multisubunit potassium/proton antiporter, PhaG subunit (TC 2.A.63.1.1) [Kaistia soli DSM 19436]|uniref:Multisubunit potassium/proton antiporter, PhaG subunit (TC 2.A.63.1.1) n=1 Tax=Kaistia soli DSM 19436 TaxID=1122133 RepID=A0A1M5L2P7_9HYPH|nr:monovalent cation/H(+) antiporter subunit G [Kaistia soli]SHG59266.1 multisubunit potassium/proton antiporter, PhaG subunit (TC 2.A.63.1.1) [Kaistia soli DSM 19436]